MQGKIILLLITLMTASFQYSFAGTKTWTGLAGDGLWATTTNWSGNSAPTASDDVVLDNAVVAADYTVTLPITAVTVKTISITPAGGHTILLLLPVGNTADPAFTVTGPGYGIIIDNGGILKNASGRSTGTPLAIGDSIRINNGGRYIHNSRTASATSIIQYLSKAPGTEKGIFEFDVPGGANYAVSITNRVYGTLVFSAAANGSSRAYTGTGANQLTVNGNLEINAGATFNVDLSGTNGNVLVKGNYIQNGGVFNIAGVANNTVVKIAGNLQQSATGSITETDAGLPVIELNGTTPQAVALRGTITNSVLFRINNPSGILLQAPLSLPYKLDLVKGAFTTSSANLLTLLPDCAVIADSSSANSFIDGPLRKEGLLNTPYFLFPVGKPADMHWVELKQATGNFTVEFIKSDPHGLSTAFDTSIAAVSNTGYWIITPDAVPAASAYTGLAYYGPNNAGITDMNTARVAQLSGGIWMSRGNTGFTGNAGAAGSVTSQWLNPFPNGTNYYTLGAAAVQNALAIVQDPQTNSTKLLVKASRKTEWKIALFNMQGVQLRTFRLIAPAGNTFTTIDLAGLPAGVYLLMACDGKDKCMVRPFLKQ